MSSKSKAKVYYETLTPDGVKKLKDLLSKITIVDIKNLSSVKKFLKDDGNLSDLNETEFLDEVADIPPGKLSTILKAGGRKLSEKYEKVIIGTTKDKEYDGPTGDKAKKVIISEFKKVIKNASKEKEVAKAAKSAKKVKEDTIKLDMKQFPENKMSNKEDIPKKAKSLIKLIAGEDIEKPKKFITKSFTKLVEGSEKSFEGFLIMLQDAIEKENPIPKYTDYDKWKKDYNDYVQKSVNFLAKEFKEQTLRCTFYLMGGKYETLKKVGKKQEDTPQSTVNVYKYLVKSLTEIKSIDFTVKVSTAPTLFYLRSFNEYMDKRALKKDDDITDLQADLKKAKKDAGDLLNFLDMTKTIEEFAKEAENIRESEDVAKYFSIKRKLYKLEDGIEKDTVDRKKKSAEETKKKKDTVKQSNIKTSAIKGGVTKIIDQSNKKGESTVIKKFLHQKSMDTFPYGKSFYYITTLSDKITDLKSIYQSEWKNEDIVLQKLMDVLGKGEYGINEKTTQEKAKSIIQKLIPNMYVLRFAYYLAKDKSSDVDAKAILAGDYDSVKELSGKSNVLKELKKEFFPDMEGELTFDNLSTKLKKAKIPKTEVVAKKTKTSGRKKKDESESESEDETPKKKKTSSKKKKEESESEDETPKKKKTSGKKKKEESEDETPKKKTSGKTEEKSESESESEEPTKKKKESTKKKKEKEESSSEEESEKKEKGGGVDLEDLGEPSTKEEKIDLGEKKTEARNRRGSGKKFSFLEEEDRPRRITIRKK